MSEKAASEAGMIFADRAHIWRRRQALSDLEVRGVTHDQTTHARGVRAKIESEFKVVADHGRSIVGRSC